MPGRVVPGGIVPGGLAGGMVPGGPGGRSWPGPELAGGRLRRRAPSDPSTPPVGSPDGSSDATWPVRPASYLAILAATGPGQNDADAERSHRQLGVVGVDSQATYTGSDCLDWAGGRAGTDEGGGRYAIQGNILVGEHVVADMERAWFESAGSPLERRLIAVLLAGDAAGGDARGRQSAALLVVAPGEGYDGSGVRVDLRVDDHADAPRELARVLELSELYFGSAEDVEPLTGELGAEVGDRLHRLGYDGPVAQALAEWAGVENYEMRLTDEGIDARVLAALRRATAD